MLVELKQLKGLKRLILKFSISILVTGFNVHSPSCLCNIFKMFNTAFGVKVQGSRGPAKGLWSCLLLLLYLDFVVKKMLLLRKYWC